MVQTLGSTMHDEQLAFRQIRDCFQNSGAVCKMALAIVRTGRDRFTYILETRGTVFAMGLFPQHYTGDDMYSITLDPVVFWYQNVDGTVVHYKNFLCRR